MCAVCFSVVQCVREPYMYISIHTYIHTYTWHAWEITGGNCCDQKGRTYRSWATNCNMLTHTDTHCNALKHAATHCNILLNQGATASNSNVGHRGRVRHTATYCNTKQHTANTLRHTATHCNTLTHTATHCNILQRTATHFNTLQHTATHCTTLQHTANTLQHQGATGTISIVWRNGLVQHTAAHWHTLQHTATHYKQCNTLQHVATHCNTLQRHCNIKRQLLRSTLLDIKVLCSTLLHT